MGRLIDVTLDIHPGMVVWPGDARVRLTRTSRIEDGANANVSELQCSAHTGTHVDAPYHFLREGKTIEHLPLDMLIGPAYIADLPSISMLGEKELESAQVPEGVDRLLIKTRNSGWWADEPEEFRDDYVGLDSSGAEWLVRRGVRLVGLDYLSVATRRQTKPVHDILLKMGMVLVEGLNLSAVVAGRCKFYCFPLKLRGSDGAPARAVVEVE